VADGFGAAELLGWTDVALAAIADLRGWTEDAIARLELAYLADEHRVGIPVRDETGGEVGELHYDPTGRLRPKMLAGAGTPRALFPPPELLGDDLPGRRLWLVEGEPDAIRLWSLGVPAVAVPGAQSWRDEWAGRFTGRRWTMLVCFDCDDPGRAGARAAAAAIVQAGGDARIVDLSPDRADGYDLTDFTLYRDDAAQVLQAIADDVELYRPEPAAGTLALRIVPVDEFAAVDEPGAQAILGTADNAIIPEGGDAMVYGDGGVGKTTLVIDLACHLAAGDDWLGLNVPSACRILLVENEGPRPLFRRKLERKLAGWQGSPLDGRIVVLEEPWGQLDFASPAWRDALVQEVAARQIDVLVVGPVTSAGMDGAGTIAEARAFLALVGDVRTRSGRPVAVLLVHHENKGGKVSGAWEGTGDTLLHVQQQGHGQVRLYFQKARWASEQHATTLQLAWAEGDSFSLVEAAANRPEAVWETLEQFVLAHPGCTWKAVLTTKNDDGTKIVRGDLTYLGRRRDQMLDEGVLINAGRGGSFALWHRDDPARPMVVDDPSEGFSGTETNPKTSGFDLGG
jgi:hypothetical protein